MLEVALLVLAGLRSALGQASAYDQVNVFIGSGGHAYGYGSVNPAAQVPFGVLRLGPDTTTKAADLSFRHFSGYHYDDDMVRAFSHTHLFGAGVNDLGTFGVMPYNIRNSEDILPKAANFWWSSYAKETEKASPGFYSVSLSEPNVDVQLIAISNMAGVHKYTYTHLSDQLIQRPGLVFDACHAAKVEYDEKDQTCLNATISIDPAHSNKFTARVSFDGSFTRGMWVYLAGEVVVNNPAVKLGGWTMCAGRHIRGLSCEEGGRSLSSTEGKLFAALSLLPTGPKFLTDSFSLELRVAVSFISEEQAGENLLDALRNRNNNFDSLVKDTKEVWSNEVSALSVQAMDDGEEGEKQLHSAHYRTLLSPSDYTEAGGLYRGADGQVHNVLSERSALYASTPARSMRFYSDLSFWDTFRTLHPWQLLSLPSLAVGVARSVGEITAQQQAFPRWMLGGREGSCMLGLHGSALIVEGALAGLGGEFDLPTMQRLLLLQSTTAVPMNGRADVDNYMQNGFVSSEAAGDAASHTLSYAYDDYLLSLLSSFVGDEESAAEARERSLNFQKIWSNDSHIFCGRSLETGALTCPRTPTSPEAWSMYREGDAWHWAFFVPHNVPGLIALYPSPQDFQASLSNYMEKHLQFQQKGGNSLPNPYYWAGNEHNHLSPWLFSFLPGGCTLTQYWTRLLPSLHFSNSPGGVPGNEDYGAMASWLLFASLGLFPLPGSTTFFLGSPRLLSGSLRLEQWQAPASLLSVSTVNNSPQNVYVDRVEVNGRPWASPFIDRKDLVNGGQDVTLVFYMHSEASSSLCL